MVSVSFPRITLAALAVAAGLACDAPGRADVGAPPVQASAPAPVTAADATGSVSLVGRAFADDRGPWNAFGASLFWSLWGERHDPDRLDANLAFLAAHDVDFVRMLAMVGASSWADRAIDPGADDYWLMAARLFDRLARHGLRAQIVLFADAQAVMPDAAARRRFADAWADFGNRHRDRVQLMEIANEYFQNGVDLAEVRQLGSAVRQQTTVPVALSAPPPDLVTRMYAGWPAVATLHYDRDQRGDAGVWGPVLQPWWQADVFARANGAGAWPAAVVNNEPVGPGASVASDEDPVRLAAAFVTTFLAGNAAFVYHTGAGIRGGGEADRARGRAANISEEPPAIIEALAVWRAQLPAGLANWRRLGPPDPDFPLDGFADAIRRGDLRAAPAATDARQVIVQLVDQRTSFDVAARRSLVIRLRDQLTGEDRAVATLRDGERWTVPHTAPASILFVTGN